MSDAAFLRILVSESVRALVGTAPSLVEQERAIAAGMAAMRPIFGGTEVRLYVPKVGTFDRARRAREIRAAWTGANAGELASRFGISERHVRRIVGGR